MAMEGYLQALQAAIDAQKAEVMKWQKLINKGETGPGVAQRLAREQEKLRKTYESFASAQDEAKSSAWDAQPKNPASRTFSVNGSQVAAPGDSVYKDLKPDGAIAKVNGQWVGTDGMPISRSYEMPSIVDDLAGFAGNDQVASPTSRPTFEGGANMPPAPQRYAASMPASITQPANTIDAYNAAQKPIQEGQGFQPMTSGIDAFNASQRPVTQQSKNPVAWERMGQQEKEFTRARYIASGASKRGVPIENFAKNPDAYESAANKPMAGGITQPMPGQQSQALQPSQADLFTKGFGGMMAQMFQGPSPQESANAANAARLRQMLANVDQMGGYESEQIDDTTRGGKASAMQGLISRGLGATSITAPIAQRYDERGRLQHQALRGRLAGMKNSILGGVNDVPITSNIAAENQRGYDEEMARA